MRVEDEIIRIEQKIEMYENHIIKLKKHLENLKTINPDIDLSKKLSTFPDFPCKPKKISLSHKLAENRIVTVNNLINSSEKDILNIENIGIKTLKDIEKWMDAHQLCFLDQGTL